MLKNLKVGALLAGGVVGALSGHYYKPAEAEEIVFGALIGAFVVNWIIGMAN